jgi:hypothetical protein
MFESGMTQQVTNVLRSIRGRSLALDTGSYCIAETENGYVQFMADMVGMNTLRNSVASLCS